MPQVAISGLVRFIGLVAAYYATGHFGLTVPYLGSHISLIWAPAGIALGALLRWGPSSLPAVWLGAFLVNLAVGSAPWLAAGIACGNTLGPWAAAAALRRLGFDRRLERRYDLALYLALATAGMAVNASNGVVQLRLAGLLGAGQMPQAWLYWWLGDSVGALTAGIPLLTWSTPVVRRAFSGRRGREVVLIGAALFTLGALLFPASFSDAAPLLFLPMLGLMLLAARGGVCVASTAALLLSAQAAWAVSHGGGGPLHADSMHQTLMLLWSYMAMLSLATVLIALVVVELATSEQQMRATIAERQRAERELQRQHALGAAIRRVQSLFIRQGELRTVFDSVLTELLDSSGSKHGFIGEVLRDAAGRPYLKTFALTNIAWNADARALYEVHAAQGLEFRNLKTLFGQVMLSGEALIANDPAQDPGSGGLPPGHPPLNAFVGVPLYGGGQLLGVVGLANREGGYDNALLEFLEPLLSSVAGIVAAVRLERERRQAEEAVREREALLSKLSGQVPGMIFLCRMTPDGKLRLPFVSAGVKALFEIDGKDVVADVARLYQRIHPDDRDRVITPPRSRAGMLNGWTCDYRAQLPQAGLRWHCLQAAAEPQPDGCIVWYGYVSDITERKRAEERMGLFENVFKYSPSGIMITDAQRRVVEINAAFTALTGYTRDEMLGQRPNLLATGRLDGVHFDEIWRCVEHEGHWRGEVWDRGKNGESFAELLTVSGVRAPEGAISHYVGQFTDITPLKRQQERLERMAHFDALTQLPNRVLLADRLQQALAQARRTGRLLAVCYLDLDGFKEINDRLGHAVGDRLLVAVADRLRSQLRGSDTLARLGGDEFVVLLNNLDSAEEVEQGLSRLLATVAEPYSAASEEPLSVSASVGVALYPSDDVDPDALLRHADQAMYLAKQAGHNRYHLFDPELDRRARRHHELRTRVEAALAAGEFRLHYQPQVNLRSGRVVGAEALLRWYRPGGAPVLPKEFLPVIENSEFAVKLGEWVLTEALRQATRWARSGLVLGINVNLFARHLELHDFTERMKRLLARYPEVRSGQLELEVLESAALGDVFRVSRAIEECRRLGLRFALDDFGTGYSSLSYLRRLPADSLKIDQSFIRDMLGDPDDLAIVEGVIGLAAAFRRRVVAEGVETAEHGRALLRLGCEFAQGFGIARAMHPALLPAWIAQYERAPLLGIEAASRAPALLMAEAS
jgi:diguanylate cyclase (GGDEF)-like protein/PAS domain S-box-containing protein